jgi:hypothetical protein
MIKIKDSQNLFLYIWGIVLAFFIAIFISYGASTISTNISTDGTLTVAGNVAVDTSTLIVDASNNRVGVGTTTPNWLLQINASRPFFALSDSASSADLKHWTLSSQGGNLYFATSSDSFATSTTPRLTILSTGLVGVNTASPSTNLDVAGTFNISGAATLGSTLNVTGLATLGNATTTQLTVADKTFLGDADADSLTVRAGVWSLTSTATTTVALTQGVNFDSDTFVIDPNANSVAIGTTTGANFIKKHLSNSASLNFGAIGANSCSELTISVVGAADGDTVVLGVPNALASASTTLAFYGFVSAANTVTVRACQVAGQATSDPAAATIRADVWGH